MWLRSRMQAYLTYRSMSIERRQLQALIANTVLTEGAKNVKDCRSKAEDCRQQIRNTAAATSSSNQSDLKFAKELPVRRSGEDADGSGLIYLCWRWDWRVRWLASMLLKRQRQDESYLYRRWNHGSEDYRQGAGRWRGQHSRIRFGTLALVFVKLNVRSQTGPTRSLASQMKAFCTSILMEEKAFLQQYLFWNGCAGD